MPRRPDSAVEPTGSQLSGGLRAERATVPSPLKVRGAVALLLTSAALGALAVSGIRAPPPQQPQIRTDERRYGKPIGVHLRSSVVALPRGQALSYPLARLVPADALAFVSVRSLPRLFREAARTGIARMFQDPEVEPFLQKLSAELAERNAGLVATLQALKLSLAGEPGGEAAAGGGPAGASPHRPEVRPAGEAALAILGFDREKGPGVARTEAVFLADMAGRESQARTLVEVLEAYAWAGGRVRRHGVGKAAPARPLGQLGAWTVHEGLLVAGTSPSAVKGVLDRAARLSSPKSETARRTVEQGAGRGPALDSLELDEGFRTSVERAALAGGPEAGHDYLVYVDIERALGELFAGPAGEVLARFGLDGLKSIALVGRIQRREDASVREAVYLHSPGERDAALDVLRGPGITLSTARLAPSRSLVALFAPANGPAACEAILGGPLRRLGPPFRALVDPVARCARPLGGSAGEPEGGDACAFLWSVSRINWFPRLGFVGRISDDANDADFAEAWRDLARALGGRVREHRIEGPPGFHSGSGTVVVRSILGMRYLLPLAYLPASCLTGEHLIVTTDATAVRDLLRPAGGGLAESEGLKAVLGELPEERRFLLYADIPRIVDRAFEPYARAVIDALLPGSLESFDREEMPPGAAIARHLAPAACSVLSDAEGVRIDALTPAGLLPTIGSVALIVDALLFEP